jgi:hypothetical protein
MGFGTSRSMVRRLQDPMFARWYFVGDGIDIGSGEDPLTNYTMLLPGMKSVFQYDRAIDPEHDANTLPGIPAETFDFIHSAHCLEHMQNPITALYCWWKVLKPGGHMVVLVPDEDLYEQGIWPSTFNDDHKSTFTIWKEPGTSWSPVSSNLATIIPALGSDVEIKYIKLCDAMQFRHVTQRIDQTMLQNAESAIEFVLRKRLPTACPAVWRNDEDVAAVSDSLITADRLYALKTLLLKTQHLEGQVWECGVYRGGSAALLHRIMIREFDPRTPLRLFDSFIGLPLPNSLKGDTHHQGEFGDTTPEIVLDTVGRGRNVFLHPGFIPDTFRGLEQCKIRFAHIDVDLYQSVLDCCQFIWPRLVHGGIMVFDDYKFSTCMGARKAVDEWCASARVELIHLESPQVWVRKP